MIQLYMFCKLRVEACFFKFLFQSTIYTTKNSDDPVRVHSLTASHISRLLLVTVGLSLRSEAEEMLCLEHIILTGFSDPTGSKAGAQTAPP